ncbi:hypothetical protein [Streptomyces sp. N50]|uniref:hypothetical protein n=1 Tax=Streptomyces sp. N50 TaxID=3081765 RepID=UPI002962146F|nr:hypothetical protein [Streptomyces sp. N50]WOX09186.1 hypothetical protein R2B38_09930 [Streptomyces sp. N50]
MTAEAITRLLLQPPPPQPGAVPRLHLIGATITGNLQLSHAKVEIPAAFIDCRFDNEVDLSDASLCTVDLTGSSLPALNADRLKVEGDLTLIETVGGTVSLFRSDIAGDMWLNGAELVSEDSGYALRAPQLRVDGGLYAQAINAVGGINLWGAQAFTLEVTKGRLSSTGHAALRCDGLRIAQDLHCAELSVDGGGISLFGATIGGQWWFNGATVRNHAGWAVSAPSVRVGGGIYANGMSAHGGINLFAATVGESIELSGCTLTSHGDHALRAPGVRVEADLNLDVGATITSGISLPRAEIKGTLQLSDSTFAADASTIDLQHAVVGVLDMMSTNTRPLACDLRAATIGRIHDSPTAWPPRIELDGLTYQGLRPLLPATQRLAWLDRSAECSPHAYERLATYYRQLGHDDDARTVQLARHRKRRNSARLPDRFWGYFEDLTVGYGYRPSRALVWLFALTTLVAIVFAAVPPQPVRTDGPAFQPVAFALDVILPILDLGQERAFAPSGNTAWVAWAGAIAGWLLATTVIAGVTRRLSRSGH